MDINEFERIVHTRRVNGRHEYLVKRKNFPITESTWVPKDIVGPELIAKFKNAPYLMDQNPNGFERGLHPFKVVGASISEPGKINYLMQWMEDATAELIPSQEVSTLFPELVIEFFEERITWIDNSDVEDVEDVEDITMARG